MVLIQYICPKCRCHLLWAMRTATVYCRKCDRWITVKELKEAYPLEMDPSKEKEQLKMF
ncbi:Hypothetical protein LUCI_3512 [Lucifera butyrica]|uniref:Uncharacterized protein n=1 Tax=Lucifera butyrica TaxID=1351585 RepID=A0A498RDT3_9FIRM|nr:hypothetical protein [Lucifera butyrica]VBB08243.1 Hypothetical protein LUCI_3512 [Lucifera butyrica]